MIDEEPIGKSCHIHDAPGAIEETMFTRVRMRMSWDSVAFDHGACRVNLYYD